MARFSFRSRGLLALVLVIAASFGPRETGAQTQGGVMATGIGPPGHSDLTMTATGPLEWTLDLETPVFATQTLEADGQPCQAISIEGYGAYGKPGDPALPMLGAMLGIPAESQLTLTILDAQVETLKDRYAICPATRPVLEESPDGSITAAGLQMTRDAGAYGTEGFLPGDLVVIASTGAVRSQHVAVVQLHPFQYNPTTGELRQANRLRVLVRATGGPQPDLTAPAEPVDEGAFEPVLRSALLNYEQARMWRTPPAPQVVRAASPVNASPSYKMSVITDGMYQVTYGDLLEAGLAAADLDALDPRTFRVTNLGQELAILVEGEDDGRFNAGDAIVFYGKKASTRYADANIYWLTWGGAYGERMADVPAPGAGATAQVPAFYQTALHLEQDRTYQPARPSGPQGDRWYWERINAISGTASRRYEFPLSQPAGAPYAARVTGLLRSLAATPAHRTRVLLNGQLINDATWISGQSYAFSAAVPQSVLVDGLNTLTLEVLQGGGIILQSLFTNWFEITYWRAYQAVDDQIAFDGETGGTWEYQAGGFNTDRLEAYEITDPTAPRRVAHFTVSKPDATYRLQFSQTITAESHYLAQALSKRLTPQRIVLDEPSDLRSPANAADYIVISHDDFVPEAELLAAWRAGQGLRTVVVDVQDVYDEFSGGVFDPNAIRDFLAYAYGNWAPPAPAYVLLVGDGNYDYKNLLGTGEANYIPPNLQDVDPYIGETATDNRFATVVGNDYLPDLYVGRLPAKTSAEVNAMVRKLMLYDKLKPHDDWASRVLFVADKADPLAGNFPAMSDDIVNNHVPAFYEVDRAYYGVNYPTSAATRAAILAAIDEGRLLVSFIGHAAPSWWSGDKIFQTSDVASLNNADRLPFFVPMTCQDGYFINPTVVPTSDPSSLGEVVTRAAGKGAIASWSPAGLGVASGHDILERGLFDALFRGGQTRIGPATHAAMLYLHTNAPGYQDLIDTYILFGDPATRLKIPFRSYVPLIQRD